ncbi:MAG: beta-propeller domain-containing protein [Halobacteriales archaeon]|nr:beta-propeller domain-containing protein [Halobacteriales archaeon]
MEKRKRAFWLTGVAFVAFVALAALVAGVYFTDTGEATGDTEGISTFTDADDFRQYLANAPQRDSGVRVGQTAPRDVADDAEFAEGDAAAPRRELEQAPSGGADGGGGAGDGTVQRESDTNVQVEGIDEPDIMKTSDGRIFYSSGSDDETKVVDALPPEDMTVTDTISGSGDMLLGEGNLVALRDGEMVGYDINGSPSETWTAELDDGIVEARLHDGTVYAVLSSEIDRENPCPIRPMSVDGRDVVVPCDSIHRPDEPTDVDTTYTVVGIDAETGETEGRTSFVGSTAKTVVYVSRDSLYVTYTREESEAELMLDFALNEGRDLFDETTVERLERLEGYELSDRAKRVELESILEDWRDSLSDDERIQAQNEFENRLEDYFDENLRELETTGIVRTDLESFEVDATGEVPGYPLNQFALDEHNGNLRVATTVGESLSRQRSENDVYVLDDSLERRSEATGLGEGQRVYSVRFIGDTGYVVTFRQVDPFYVIDMSDPDDITVEGELKLPGYSSYLHPLGEDRVLGIGEENGRVKAVIFDVSDPTDPTIDDDYVLDEYSSDAVGNHRAFLHDERHEVFFLPGSQAGYVFSYEDGLSLERAVNVTRARRAAYINDYMYVASDHEIVALDENDWSRAGRVEIGDEPVVHPPHPIEPMPEPRPDLGPDR